MASDYTIYGVQNDEEIQKLLNVIKGFDINFSFKDFRDSPPTDAQFDKWAEYEGEELPLNQRSTSFKKNRRHFEQLPLEKRKDWLRQNYHLILRPIIENGQGDVLAIGGRPERLIKVVFGLDV